MKLLLVAVAVMCCDAVPVQQRLMKTYLYSEATSPSVIRIPAPGINLVIDTYDADPAASSILNSVIKSRVPSPVLVKRLEVTPGEPDVSFEPLDPTHQRSIVPVPVPVLLTLDHPVDSLDTVDIPAPENELALDEDVGDEEVISSPVTSPVLVVAAPEPLEAPEPPMPSLSVPFVGGQFHAQDELKQYSFSHWGGPTTRVETKDALGRTHGSFAYVNPDGDVQVRKYAAAPAMGFKVAASDLPDDTPEVAKLKAAHQQAHRTFLSFRDEIA